MNKKHLTSGGTAHAKRRWLVLLLLAALCLPTDASETERLYLSGRDKDDTVPWRFQCTSGANSGIWTNLPVPSHWDLHGFGTLTYRQDATNAANERGLYEHDFVAPKTWAGKRVMLVFEGAMTDTTAKLNGQPVGPTHQGGFYRFKYEVTQLIKPGTTNRLEVEVARHSSNASVNRAERMADYWVFAGIYRPVYLEALPESFIERVAINARADGEFALNVFTDGRKETDSIVAQIQTTSGNLVGRAFGGQSSDWHAVPSQTGKATLQLATRISQPRQWTAETPHLYRVEVRLQRAGKIIHTYQQRFGFRTMEVRDGDGLYVNGRKVILKGVNRHSFWPDSGRCLSEAVHRLDIETIKDMNGNAVRMSHYPPDVEFLELCDELGLYVLDELAGWQKAYDTTVGTKLVESMLARDVNHPSILLWDNGNEGGWNPNLEPIFARFDPQQRRVVRPWEPINGINSIHYLSYSNATIAASGAPMNHHVDKKTAAASPPGGWIYLPTEFLHGLFDGGAGAGLEDYWTMMMTNKNCAGGFLWAMLDEAVRLPNGTFNTSGNEAPDGVVGPYRQREGSFYTAKELWSPIQVTRETDTSFTIKNDYGFTDVRDCRLSWELRRFPGPGTISTNHEILAAGRLKAPSIPPGSRARLHIKLPKNWQTADALALRVDDPHGRELWTWVWPVGQGLNTQLEQSTTSKPVIPITMRQDDNYITLSRGDLNVQISRQSGLLHRVEMGARKFSLANGPRLATGESKVKSVTVEQVNGEPVITAGFAGDLQEVSWRLQNDGSLDCKYSYQATGNHKYFGVLFDYPEQLVERKRWVGNGPYRVWKNRLRGGTFGLWANDYNNTITGYRDWVYPEFKGCFSGVRWLQLETREGLITVSAKNVPFIQVLCPQSPPAGLQGHAHTSLPACGLGFLDAIPPIGSKFSGPETTGPQGQMNLGRGWYSGKLSFTFKPGK